METSNPYSHVSANALSIPPPHDLIAIKDLDLPHGIIAPDVWGNPKEQPAKVSVSLVLSGDGFSTASGNDLLDESTINYGLLSKRIRSGSQQGQTVTDLQRAVDGAIRGGGANATDARNAALNPKVARQDVELKFLKASMFGTGIRVVESTAYDNDGGLAGNLSVFHLQDVTIMTLVGVNDYERSREQPLVMNLFLYMREMVTEAQSTALFGLEQILVQIVQGTAFETLETLIQFIFVQLQEKLLSSLFPGATVKLRIEKPRAIAFADAPAIEVVREVPSTKAQSA